MGVPFNQISYSYHEDRCERKRIYCSSFHIVLLQTIGIFRSDSVSGISGRNAKHLNLLLRRPLNKKYIQVVMKFKIRGEIIYYTHILQWLFFSFIHIHERLCLQIFIFLK